MKTSSTPWMKRITMYICFIIALCFFNLVAIKAEDPIYKATTYITQQGVAPENEKFYDAVDKAQQKADEVKEAQEQAKTLFWASVVLSVSTCISTILATTAK